MPAPVSTPCMRKTRIVCVSDTHNQTPKLPRGDVLIHAGDLTNQGSYSELKKAVEWVEKQDFEAKIVVAGNHEITLDAPFFNKNKGLWKWPGDQDPTACKKLLVESKSITYLEHTTTTVKLTSPNGPGTRFTVFGSPYTPQQANWAFQYRVEEAEDLWNKIPEGVDIVVTHTPPKGHCDRSAEASRDGREGCPALLRRLSKIRPKLSICGHIHRGRGVETVRWRTQPLDQATQSDSGSLVQSVEFWSDPGRTSNKLSLVDLTIKSRAGRDLGCDTGLPRQGMPDSMQEGTVRSQAAASPAPDVTWRQPPSGDGNLVPTSSLTGIALENNEAWWRGENHSKNLRNAGHACLNDGCRTGRAFGGAETARIATTTVVNAAYLGPRIAGKPTGHHKPIVVDVQVPVWKLPDEE